MTRQIEILVSPVGETTIQTHGFTGTGCRDASRFMEAALGHVEREQLTAEFHQAVAQQASQEQRL